MPSAHRGKKIGPSRPPKPRGRRNSGRPRGRPAGRGKSTAALLMIIGIEVERIEAAHPGWKDDKIAKEISGRGIPSSRPGVPIRVPMSVDTIRKSLPAARREYAAFREKAGLVNLPPPAAPKPIELPTGGLLDGLSKLGRRD